eukprot:m.692227 g.692227  ORF g.692227 m.692227 type:complete len:388 (+) comp22861_c0_seq2:179-1342(+)
MYSFLQAAAVAITAIILVQVPSSSIHSWKIVGLEYQEILGADHVLHKQVSTNCSRADVELKMAGNGGGSAGEFARALHGWAGRHHELPAWLSYESFMMWLAFQMGLGKGGVPGASTSAVALGSLFAPDGCLDLAIALGVPITFVADLTIVYSYYAQAEWAVITQLLAPTAVGLGMGARLIGSLSPAQAKTLVGSIISCILVMNLVQEAYDYLHRSSITEQSGKTPQSDKAGTTHSKSTGSQTNNKGTGQINKDPPVKFVSPAAYATSWWFAGVIGVIGGFATILTNSMGPMLNVYFLTLRMTPTAFVGTRSTFFTMVNLGKLVQRLWTGTLPVVVVVAAWKLMLLSVLGALASKIIVRHLSTFAFVVLQYISMSYAAYKLLSAGLLE